MKLIKITDKERKLYRKEKIKDRVVAGIISGIITGVIISFFQLMLHYYTR